MSAHLKMMFFWPKPAQTERDSRTASGSLSMLKLEIVEHPRSFRIFVKQRDVRGKGPDPMNTILLMCLETQTAVKVFHSSLTRLRYLLR